MSRDNHPDFDLAARRQRAMQRHWAEMDRIAALGLTPTQSSVDVAREHLPPQKPRIRVEADVSRKD